MEPDYKRLSQWLLLFTALGACAVVFALFGWYRSVTQRVSRLSPEERQALINELLDVSPGVHEWAWFEPSIGYTLKHKQQITVWNDTFTSNELGYRTGAVDKPVGVFRVLFVGDSWTFGMGVSERESFPRQFEALANENARAAVGQKRIESWTLALPGYNTFNEVNALWFFYDRLAPDMVVFCPTINDNHSMAAVLPNGSLSRAGVMRDQFGENHALAYRVNYLDSYRYQQRWQQAFGLIRQAETRLEALGVPTMHFFAAPWHDPYVFKLVSESGLRSPFVITPIQFTRMKWRNPPPIRHGNPEANRIFGRMVYQGVAEVLDWPLLEPARDGSNTPLHRAPPPPQEWEAAAAVLMAEETNKIPEAFEPGEAAEIQAAGPLHPETGLMRQATTLLVRRAKNGRYLNIALTKLKESPSLYPLRITVDIPSPSGGSRIETEIPAGGDPEFRFSIEIPADIAIGSAMDIRLSAERAAMAPDLLAPRTFYITAILQSMAP